MVACAPAVHGRARHVEWPALPRPGVSARARYGACHRRAWAQAPRRPSCGERRCFLRPRRRGYRQARWDTERCRRSRKQGDARRLHANAAETGRQKGHRRQARRRASAGQGYERRDDIRPNSPGQAAAGNPVPRAHDRTRYHAIAHGVVNATRVETDLLLDRGDGMRGSYGHFRRANGDPPIHAKHSVTHIQPIAALAGATLVECRLESGRQHQIRIHLSELGHPLVGERLYIRDYVGPTIDAVRPMLHARTLGFVHPRTGRTTPFRARATPGLSGHADFAATGQQSYPERRKFVTAASELFRTLERRQARAFVYGSMGECAGQSVADRFEIHWLAWQLL